MSRFARGVWGILTGDPFCRYRLAEKVAGWISPHCLLSEYGRSWVRDEAFLRDLEPFEGRGNRRSLDRKWMLTQLLKLARKVDGDSAECGAWRGGSSWLIARGLNRTHHVFDSFEGLSPPAERDGAHFKKGDLAVSEEEFRTRMAGIPGLQIYKGWIPTRFPEIADRRFCLVHVDVDLHQPTRDSIDFFYPRLNRGGILLLDDYGFHICPGAREAADDYFRDKPEPILELPSGQGLVIKE